jgi:hypothetical protein
MPDSPIKAASFEKAWTGTRADVRMSVAEKKAYDQAIGSKDEISIKRRVHLQRFFKEFCENDDFTSRLNERQFKREGKFPDGRGGNATIWTFKAWQWRVYGSIMIVEGRRCFVGVKVDPNKKQDRADQKVLKATAKAIGAVFEYK